MKVMHFDEAETKSFEGGGATGVIGRLLIGQADGAPNFAMRLFEVAEGGATPRHAHAWEHEVFVHSGKGAVWCSGKWIDVAPGSVVFVPGGEEHQFCNTGSATLRFVCLVPRGSPEL